MSQIDRTSFTNRLRGYLGPKWMTRGTAASRIDAIDRSFSSDPVAPIDAIYTSLTNEQDASEHYAGFKSATRQLLSDDILNTLIQIQSDMLAMDDQPFTAQTFSERAIAAYQHAAAAFPQQPVPVYYFGS